MAQILLTSERFVKSVTNVSDNLAGKFLQPAIREAQDVQLREVLGAALLRHLKDIVAAEAADAPGNEAYRDLLAELQYYLAYTAIVEVANKVAYKIANAGVVKTPDERVETATDEEIGRQVYYYQAKADSYCILLQRWLVAHAASFPELNEDECCRLRANLTSAATCGVWLGGARGKRYPGRGGRR